MIRLLCLCSLLSVGASLNGQTLTTNSDGQRIIVYPDGTTKLFDEPSATAQATSPETTVTRQATPEQEADARLALRREVSALGEELESLAKLAKKARGREAKLTNRVRKLRESKKTSDRSQVEIVNQSLLAARKEYQTAEAARQTLERRSTALQATQDMSIAQRERYLREQGLDYMLDPLAKRARDIASDAHARAPREQGPDEASPEALATGKRARDSEEFRSYDPRLDPAITPPNASCVVESNGIDEFTNRRRITLAPETFFTYTSPELKPFLGAESLMTCNARLIKSGKTVMLETTFVIRSQFAAKEFGVLPKGSQMTFRTVTGQKLAVRNQIASQAEYDPIAKISTYQGRYLLSKSAQKLLSSQLLDEVRVMWGTGFDDYAIYDLTFLQRQLACI